MPTQIKPMPALIKGLGRWLALSAAVAVAGGIAGVLWLRQSVPAQRGAVTLSGLQAPVRILFDADAVPTILATGAADAYAALGWLHARDRLWQMELMRRLGAGRLAETFPPALVGDWPLRWDRTTRTLGLYRLAEASFQVLAPEVKDALQAYAAGVNQFLAAPGGPLPLEFQLLALSPEPWRPADSLVWGKLMALQLSANFPEELLRARLAARLSPAELADLFPGGAGDGPVTLAEAAPVGPMPAEAAPAGLEAPLLAELCARVAAALPRPMGPDTASNQWVIAGGGTASGRPLLANDPHLGLQTPGIWYLARLQTPGLTLAGATAPGVPFHVLGHNGRIAWGFTTTHSDTQDLFVERPDPADPGRYLTPAGSAPFERREELIRVRGGRDQTLTIRRTRHGPVLPEDGALGTGRGPDGTVLALAFPALSPVDTSAEALYRLNRARDWPGFLAALRLHQSPQQNVGYADTGGTIGFASPGLVPVRRGGDGRLPVPGWSGAFDWEGTIPFEALPQRTDPPSGRFVNANNAVVGPDYPWRLAADWPDPSRAQRIEDRLAADGRHSLDSLWALQRDTVSLPARRLVPLMTAPLMTAPLAAAPPGAPPRPEAALSEPAQAALALLRDWDGAMDRRRPEPLIFSWWLRTLESALFAERLGPLFAEYRRELHPRVVERVLTRSPGWCDPPDRPGQRGCAGVLAESLEAALAELGRRHGPDPRRWRWGAEHRAPLDHALLGRIPLLNRWFDIGIETDGDAFTINRGGSPVADEAHPFAHTFGPGLRAVYDLADLDRSRFIIATGQSGNPLSRHFGDLVERWRDGGWKTLPARPEAGEGSGDEIRLTPGPK